MKILIVKTAGMLDAALSPKHVVDDSNQLMVTRVKKKSGDVIFHRVIVIRISCFELGLRYTDDDIQHPEIIRNPMRIAINYNNNPP